MLVEMSKSSLMDAMQHVMKAIAANNPIPILRGIRVQAQGDRLTLSASHTSMSIQCTLPEDGLSATVLREGAVVIPAGYFYEVIRKLNEGVITLETDESLIVTVKSAQSQIRLCGMDAAEFPIVLHGRPYSASQLQMNCTLLRSAIKQVAIMASTSETRPVLTGILLHCEHDRLHLIATDGVRLASRTLHIHNPANESFSAIVPAKNLREVSKMLSNCRENAGIEKSHNRISFHANGLIVESALIEGTLPSLKNIIPKTWSSEIVVDRHRLLTAVECVTVIASESIVRLTANADRLELYSKTAEIGEMDSEVALLEMNGEPFILSVNGNYLIDILRSSDCESVRIRYTGKMNPIVVLPNDSLSSSLFLLTPVMTPSVR